MVPFIRIIAKHTQIEAAVVATIIEATVAVTVVTVAVAVVAVAVTVVTVDTCALIHIQMWRLANVKVCTAGVAVSNNVFDNTSIATNNTPIFKMKNKLNTIDKVLDSDDLDCKIQSNAFTGEISTTRCMMYY